MSAKNTAKQSLMSQKTKRKRGSGRLKKDIEKLENEYKRKKDPKKLAKLGMLYYKLGDLASAHTIFSMGIRDMPENPDNYRGKADCLVVNGQEKESLEYYRMALKIDPTHEKTITAFGNALMNLNMFEDAAQLFEAALKQEDSAENNNNVGVLLFKTKHFKQSAVFFQKAVEKKPKDKNYQTNYARALFRNEQFNEAFFALYKVLKLDPQDNFIKSQLSSLGRHLNIPVYSQELKDAMMACLKTDNIEHQNFSVSWLKLFLLDPEFEHIHKLTRIHDYEEFSKQADFENLINLLSDDFCSYALRLVYNQAVDYEITLKNTRRMILDFITEGKDADTKDDFLKTLLKVTCAMGENGFMHEYPCSVSEAEEGALKILEQQIEDTKDDPRACALRIAILSCYRPLYKESAEIIELAKSLPSSMHSFWRSLITLQIEEPQEEARLRDTIPALGSLKDEVSLKVREQYEENPYPRWRYTNAQVDESKGYHFKKPFEILIAGCGTGKQVLQERFMYPYANITAVDLSLSSISYAKRKVEELGLERISFHHADILELGQLDKKFDFIMCSGVLHHMADPEAGLKVLVSLLKDKGMMNIGLYSELARATVVQLRDLVAERGWNPTPEGIRDFRDYIAGLPDDHELRYVTRWRDYYSMSMVRDLIFHVQEHRYTFLQLDEMWKRHGLSFVDFSFIFPDVLGNFIRKYPGQENFRDFSKWHEFEKINPGSFTAMYQMWLCKDAALEGILNGPKIYNALDV